MKLTELNKNLSKNIAILGFGKEGQSTLKFLKELGFKKITILDKNKLLEQELNINYILGKNYIDNLSNYDLIFKSPGISPYNEKVKPFRYKLITQSQIFFDNYKGKVIGITGTKGKSTVATLTYNVLKNIGYKVKLVGNIGNPVLEEIDILNDELYDFIVYELSSYMLEGLKLSLHIGVINNIYDCHLDWHKGKFNYEQAKFQIINGAKNKLINFELYNKLKLINGIKYFGNKGDFSFKDGLFYKGEQIILKDNNILLKGEHNRLNITAIIGILHIINIHSFFENIEILQKTLATFSGLPHRIENIGIYSGITFIDDAIATTPESTIVAIKTYGQNIGTIFLGGQDSGFKFKKLRNILEKYNISNIVLFPDTGEKIFGDLSKYVYEKSFYLKSEYSPKILKTKSMKLAVEFAYRNTPRGKICILSNAAPSFSLWSGYIEKGLQFQKEVKNYNN